MIGLQSGFIEDKVLNDILRDSQNRIKSMALIHEKLYQSENMANINFNEYINSLVKNLYNSYTIDSSRIKIITRLEDISFNIDTAIPLGLITNELISNSLKHAFPNPRSGVIEIEIKRIDTNNYELIVKDNGIGLPAGFNIDESKTLGLKLVSVLVEQINGNLNINPNNGASFTIHFNIN
jgi:two-component sensor histidine kinase